MAHAYGTMRVAWHIARKTDKQLVSLGDAECVDSWSLSLMHGYGACNGPERKADTCQFRKEPFSSVDALGPAAYPCAGTALRSGIIVGGRL